MLINLSWLEKYLEVPVDMDELARDLTMVGLNVERCITSGINDEKIIVGEVLEVAPHPNARKLSLCKVSVGDGEVKEIVCGATNVAGKQKVPVALPGAKLPDGTRIRKAKIRGIVSNGMICSETELSIGEDAHGIIVLDDGLQVGLEVGKVLGPAQSIIEIEVTPNRPDLLSHLGVAREIAALYKRSLNYPWSEVTPCEGEDRFEIIIENGEDCPRYTGRIVRGIKVESSPVWLRNLLKSVGMNSINKVVDITNFVMMELGQPLHAFDLDKLGGGTIIVRRSKRSEKLQALDRETYELSGEDLVIADPSSPVALAGIIGGEETAVTEATENILIESACFNSIVVRKTRKALNLSTEASYRFERGSDREICKKASDRASKLIMELCGGKAGTFVDQYPLKLAVRKITLRAKAIRRHLGLSISLDDVIDNSKRLELKCKKIEDDSLEVTIPSFRMDLVEEADLIEEVARTYGYDRIGEVWDYRCTTFARNDRFDEFIESIIDHLVSIGFSEVITSSFTDGKEMDYLAWSQDDIRCRMIKVRNPRSNLHSYLRTSLLPGMLEVIRRNMDQGIKRLKIHQVGKIFLQLSNEKGLPEERQILTVMMTRPKEDNFWLYSKKQPQIFEIKSIVESLAHFFRVDLWHDFCYDFDLRKGLFNYSKKNKVIIEGGLIPTSTERKYEFSQPVWYADFDVEAFYKFSQREPRFRVISEFPISKRDLSLVTPVGVTYNEIEKSLAKNGGGLVESIKLFDVYRGGNIGKEKTAYGVRIHFRSAERTLTDEEIDRLVNKMLSKLKGDLGVELRS